MANLELISDSTVIGVPELNGISHIEIFKQDIFEYGVFHYEVPPDKISENDFDYLQSKVPIYYGVYDDHIDVISGRDAIICKVPGEAAADVSEVVGIAVGIKATKIIFSVNVRNIEKIPGIGRTKRLDFSLKHNGTLIEIETKGTCISGNVPAMIADIHAKKLGKGGGIRRFGFVTLLRKPKDRGDSKLFITDPETDSHIAVHIGVYKHIYYYQVYFSFILDNPAYNKLCRAMVRNTRYRTPIINQSKIKYVFSYGGKQYAGQCFDKRLILSVIDELAQRSNNIDSLFRKLTMRSGREKYFLGIDVSILTHINGKNIAALDSYISERSYVKRKGIEIIQMEDGIIFIKSVDGSMPEMERQFTEDDVKDRLSQIMNYANHEPTECGSPCRSREKEGKPCEIKTYRGSCHFHR